MKLSELRNVIPNDTTIWLQSGESGDCIEVNEFRHIDKKYDDYKIETMFPEKYPSISSSGITVVVTMDAKKKIWIVEYAFSGGIVHRNGFSSNQEAKVFYDKMSVMPYCKMYKTENIWNQERND